MCKFKFDKQNDTNTPQLFDQAEMDRYIQYCRAVGAEPIMIAPVYGNNVDIVNKDTVDRPLTLAVDNLKPRKITFSPMSINIVTIPDDHRAEYRILEYTMQMADAGLPPRHTR